MNRSYLRLCTLFYGISVALAPVRAFAQSLSQDPATQISNALMIPVLIFGLVIGIGMALRSTEKGLGMVLTIVAVIALFWLLTQ